MAKPTTKQELIDYALRQLGAPVLEINVDDDQIDDLVDDAIQYYNERHMDGYIRTFLKVPFSQIVIDRMTTDTDTTVTNATSGNDSIHTRHKTIISSYLITLLV